MQDIYIWYFSHLANALIQSELNLPAVSQNYRYWSCTWKCSLFTDCLRPLVKQCVVRCFIYPSASLYSQKISAKHKMKKFVWLWLWLIQNKVDYKYKVAKSLQLLHTSECLCFKWKLRWNQVQSSEVYFANNVTFLPQYMSWCVLAQWCAPFVI